jgi:hypothetical protein
MKHDILPLTRPDILPLTKPDILPLCLQKRILFCDWLKNLRPGWRQVLVQ